MGKINPMTNIIYHIWAIFAIDWRLSIHRKPLFCCFYPKWIKRRGVFYRDASMLFVFEAFTIKMQAKNDLIHASSKGHLL